MPTFFFIYLGVTCPNLVLPAHGRFENVNGCTNTYGSTCRVVCDSGYEVVGTSLLQCTAKEGDGCWEGYWEGQFSCASKCFYIVLTSCLELKTTATLSCVIFSELTSAMKT